MTNITDLSSSSAPLSGDILVIYKVNFVSPAAAVIQGLVVIRGLHGFEEVTTLRRGQVNIDRPH